VKTTAESACEDLNGGGGAGGAVAGLCATYAEGHPNRSTLHLGQEVQIVDATTCQTRLVFTGIASDVARFGMYAAPDTYPVGYNELGVGEQKSVLFKGVGWTVVEICAMSSSPCEISLPSGTTSGDESCTATMAADQPWVL